MKNRTNLISVLVLIIFLGINNNAQAQAIVSTGLYTGNGQNNRNMPVLHFRPDFLMIKGGNHSAQLAMSGFQAGKTKDFNGGYASNGLITAITTVGFVLGNDNEVNKNGDSYTYMAFKELPGVIKVGTYTGNDADDRNITGIGFAPELVIIVAETNNEKPVYSTIHMGADKSMNFLNSNFDKNCIQAFLSNGFQVGKDKAVNDGGIIYHYVAIKSMVGSISIGSYVGDGASSRIITGTGIGNFTVVKAEKENAIFRTSNLPTDQSYQFKNSGSVNDRIKRNLNQGFEVGSHKEVNKSGEEYHFFQMYSNFQVLPVQWLSFNAQVLAGKTKLSWETAQEVNNAYFSVERSTDGVNYTAIGKVAGQGTTTATSRYQFEDISPMSGVSYYRLQQADDFGKISYSEVRKVQRDGTQAQTSNDTDFRIFPNPLSGNRVFVDYAFTQSQITVDVLNSNGVRVARVNLKNGNQAVELPQNLSAGNYVVIGHDGGKQLFSKQIMKIR